MKTLKITTLKYFLVKLPHNVWKTYIVFARHALETYFKG
jgi:hypothetical protein